jgi:hypothetical protein
MSFLRGSLFRLRTWLGLGDPSADHLTPGHGWLLRAAEGVLPEADDPVYIGPRLP